MNDIEILGNNLREAISQFVAPLQTSRVVDREAFHKIDHLAQLLAGKLKDNDLLSKSLLNELYLTAKVIRAEAQYIKGESTSLGEMADRIEMIFSLILRGESCDDRKPGVPRIV